MVYSIDEYEQRSSQMAGLQFVQYFIDNVKL